MYKYLYGKKKYLKDFLKGRQGLRFSDIAHYSIMENKKMRDDELSKDFVYDKNSIVLCLSGIEIGAESMATNPVFTVMPDRCFCLCLSGKKNDPALFSRFKADICLEIDIDKLVEFLTFALGGSNFSDMRVLHGEVTYYPSVISKDTPDIMSALFYKREKYSVEEEYRVAIIIPPNRETFRTAGGETVPIFTNDSKNLRHLFVNGPDYQTNLYSLVSVGYPL
ncbi:hypothetical protein [Pseudomonas syringae]|uniref:Uncharacterized protein n=1 Tax=Pseudomonas syringae UB303 TaxID=1357287 RepID=A0AAJ4B1Q1_PSESX|nr:hypothetical protein [Pseudomonas syringae]QHF08652.1 hypothetical protein N026_14715 [Pseudomonas syringae UB303]